MIQSGYQSVGPFNRIEIGAGLSALVTQGDGFSVRVETDEPSKLAGLELNATEGRLRARCLSTLAGFLSGAAFFKPGVDGHAIRLIVTAPDLIGVVASAASVVNIDSLTADEIDIAVSTGADVTIETAKARSIRLKASTSGSLSIAGACDMLHARFVSDALVAATELSCTDATIKGSRGARLELTAIGSIGGSLSSGAYLRLLGRPVRMTVKTSSGGTLDC